MARDQSASGAAFIRLATPAMCAATAHQPHYSALCIKAISASLRFTSPGSTRPPPRTHFRNSLYAASLSPALIRFRNVDMRRLPRPRLYAKSAIAHRSLPERFGHSASVPRANFSASCRILLSAYSCVQARPGITSAPVLPHPHVHTPAGHR